MCSVVCSLHLLKRHAARVAAVFYRDGDKGTEFRLWDDVYERIDADAFTRALKESHDVRALFNHDSNHILGRVSSGTLRLSVDNTGLRYSVTLPASAANVAEAMQRGDLTGSSFQVDAWVSHQPE